MFYRYPGLCSDLEPAQLYWNHTGRHCESCRKISAVRIFSSNSTFESCCHRWREVEQRWMSPQMSRRLHALLAAPLLLMSCLSNFYFFCGAQVILGQRIFTSNDFLNMQGHGRKGMMDELRLPIFGGDWSRKSIRFKAPGRK